MMKTLLCCLLLVFTGFVFGQKTVTGKVVDDSTGEPLIGATITVVGTTQGTTTDAEGTFVFSTNAREILVSYLGYTSMTVPVEDTMFIALKSESVLMQEVNVIGEGIVGGLVIKTLSTINQKELSTNNDLLITPALNRIPGVYMQSGTFNTNRITIRGIGNRSPYGTSKIRAFWNDIPLTSGTGETTIEDIDLTLLDGVDVLKGPASSVYGAGLGGLIQLRSNENRYNPQRLASVQTTVGSFGLLRNVAQFSTGEAGRYNLRINVNDTHSDGWRENNQYDRRGFATVGEFYHDKGQLSFLVNYTKQKAYIPSSIDLPTFENTPEKAAFTWKQIEGYEEYDKTIMGLSYRSEWANWLSNTTSVFASFRKNYEPRPFDILRENNQAQGGRTTFSIPFFTKKPTRLTWLLGAEFFHEDYSWQTYETLAKAELGAILSDHDEARQYANFFTQARLEVSDRLLVTVGLNYNTTDYDLLDRYTLDSVDISGDYSFDPVLSPYFSASYQLSENWATPNEASLFLIASHGFSPPSLEETLTPDGLINPDIQPERGWNFEIGSRGRLQKLSYTLSLYSMRIQDLLVARRTALDQYVGINAGKTVHNGVELALSYDIYTTNKWNWNLFANYSYSDYRFDEFLDGDSDFSGNDLTGTAPHIGSAGFILQQTSGLYATVTYQFVDAMPINDANTVFSNAYDLLDAKVGYTFSFSDHWRLNAYAGINNALDEHYASMLLINAVGFGSSLPRYYYPGLPRNYYGGLKLEYRF